MQETLRVKAGISALVDSLTCGLKGQGLLASLKLQCPSRVVARLPSTRHTRQTIRRCDALAIVSGMHCARKLYTQTEADALHIQATMYKNKR